jgi:hypothetical protein
MSNPRGFDMEERSEAPVAGTPSASASHRLVPRQVDPLRYRGYGRSQERAYRNQCRHRVCQPMERGDSPLVFGVSFMTNGRVIDLGVLARVLSGVVQRSPCPPRQ